jgi:DNA-binding NtrC family response regulator
VPARASSRSATNLANAIEEVERDLIQAALNEAAGNISQAARTLGLTRRGLYLKLKRLGFDAPAEVGN